MSRPTSDLHVTRMAPLPSPREFLHRYPATPAIDTFVAASRDAVRRILAGEDPRLLMIVGPCSIHEERAALEYAQRLARLARQVEDRLLVIMRVYFEKPRTTVGWKGLIYDPHLDGSFEMEEGLTRSRRLLRQIADLGLPAATEFLDPFAPQYLADLVSWVAIGARTTESQTHRQLASGLSMPVGFKNSTTGDSQIAVDAMISARSAHAFLGIDGAGRACVVHTSGNPDGHLILRGGQRGPNFGAAAIADALARVQAAGLPPRLLVDCSHANSDKDHTRQAIAFRDVLAQRLGGNGGIAGVMLESHLFPGSQKLGADPAALQYGVSITDACVGWEETEALLSEAAAALRTIQPVGAAH